MHLVREVPRRARPISLGRITLGLAAGAFATGLFVGPEILRSFGESKVDIARRTVRAYAEEAYAIWRLQNPSIVCPPDVKTLAVLVGHADDRDPYGEAYQMHCGEHGVYIQSIGEDARRGTADDIWGHTADDIWGGWNR
jgi:hypothetical protein